MKLKPLKGIVSVPGDKSISHRALIFSALLKGKTEIGNCSQAVDCDSTAACLRQLGLVINEQVSENGGESNTKAVTVQSGGLESLKMPQASLFAGNSGTTIRLLSGLLAGQSFSCVLDGDESLRRRPMQRVTKPLATMGATIEFLAPSGNGKGSSPAPGYAPFKVEGGTLRGQSFDLPVASAQVETAIMLAGLQAEGTTTVNLPFPVRDHTRRMFQYLDIPLRQKDDLSMSVTRLKNPPNAKHIQVPADISSAAFFIVAACLIPGSQILLKDIGMNPGRLLVLEVLRSMGANISIEQSRQFGLEPVADLRVSYEQGLKGTTVSGADIARGIDEIPILALAGAFCQGQFAVSGAEELRHKESDRLQAITENLGAAGADIEPKEDGFVIRGKSSLAGASRWKTYDDHRLAMTGLIANLICKEGLDIEETDSIKISYPGFASDLAKLI